MPLLSGGAANIQRPVIAENTAACLTVIFPNAIFAVTCSPVFNNINDGQRTMTVMKFGGAVLRNAAGFGCMSSILRGHAAPAVVVVSAFGSSTRMLEAAAEAARNGEQELALAMGRSVVAENKELARAILTDEATAEALTALADSVEQRLLNYLRGVAITRQLTGRTLDLIRSFGEFLALHIAKHFLENSGISAAAADSASLIVTDDRHGAATPLPEPTRRRLEEALPRLFETHDTAVIQGYVARGAHGEITTMGRESSNLTAALLGELLRADEVTIWTDAEGIFSADPAVVTDAIPVISMNYDDAENAAHNGVKPLYPTMIEPLRRAQVRLTYRSAFNPSGRQTVIDGNARRRPTIIAAQPRPDAPEASDVALIHVPPAAALEALRQFPAELATGDFSVCIGGGEAQKITLPTAKSAEAVKFFHRQIVSGAHIH